MSGAESQESVVEKLRKAEIERITGFPPFPSSPPDDEKGILLSDRISHYSTQYGLIQPFEDRLLRPAGYELTVGSNYSKGGQRSALADGMSLEIDPYQVAVIETYESLNMPPFLIGRWNIRVKLAYKGLLWVGGAQVDPGFRGHLCCPIYNLSDKKVSLQFREEIAVIDFVSTTAFDKDKCERFPWERRNMVVFSEYPLLNSGIAAEVENFKLTIEENRVKNEQQSAATQKTTDEAFRDVQRRIDTFLTLVFTVVAVLFAALGVIATKGSNEPSVLSSPVAIASVALYFALRSYMRIGDRQNTPSDKQSWWRVLVAPVLPELVVATVFVIGSIGYGISYNRAISSNIQSASDRADGAKTDVKKALDAIDQQRNTLNSQAMRLQQQADKLDTLQKMISGRSSQAKPKE